ncbi:caspase family protein [Planktothrix sp. FACHB-1355]|uniref:Caspase family protein n=1 Tax=Aerosakkonema funiforme FACHB-1375 TaxID=2949571 RepID=A0A926VAR9_9CYAN|nr:MULTISPECIES: caspase family protein [Oscillatoriales]MBD2180421.1 caspase family protein [Aerosakkonema funiforme FACHB-1375]MBD3561086.1 caspase family protein [Planktothrix sp. FACHB-1355]
MSNHWLMAIGINQYQYLQPLGYAQADAQAIWNFLVGRGGFMPERCLLFSDTSPYIAGHSTYPRSENIKLWMYWLCQEGLQEGDQVWFFFSGYGLKSNGEEYLMPIDGNPADIAGTGIPIRWIYESLKDAKASMQLVLLDINRAGGTQAGAQVGSQTVELARALEIPTILSCQPTQFSHEASDLQHGLFTAALLEGLRTEGGDTSIATLKRYLSERLPELCELHWRPRQEPVVVVHPATKSHQVILPDLRVPVASGYYAEAEERNSTTAEAGVSGTVNPSFVAAQHNMQTIASIPSMENPFNGNLDDIEPRSDLQDEPAAVSSSTSTTQAKNGHPGNSKNAILAEEDDDDEEGTFWRQMLLWGGGLLLLVLLLMSLFGRPLRQQTAGRQGGTSSDAVSSKSGQKGAKPKSVEQINQERLNKAKTFLQNNQVSQYSQAIATASLIKSGQPYYDEAQDSIERWSQIILDTAQGRAQRGNYSGAIAAANLIPKDPQPIYAQAQKSIKQWSGVVKQQQAYTKTLQSAKGLVKPGEASSYNKAIVVARKIPAGQPAYTEAQKSIALWSQSILNLANQRASGGDTKAAIATASLVPKNTPAYAKAQQAIAQWKRQPSK